MNNKTYAPSIPQHSEPRASSWHDRYLAVVAFPHSSAQNLPQAIDLARKARWFRVSRVTGRLMYVAGFGRTRRDAHEASALIGQVKTLKTAFLIFENSEIPLTRPVLEILECHIKAFIDPESARNCSTIVDDPAFDLETAIQRANPRQHQGISILEIKQYSFPCRILRQRFEFRAGKETSVLDQIQEAAAANECRICSKFDPLDFRETGTRTHNQWI